jgi:threonine/homoserine efflux transporter RhtA
VLAPLVVEEDPGVLLREILFVDHVLVEAWIAQEVNGASFGKSLGTHKHALRTASVRIPLNHKLLQDTFCIGFLGSFPMLMFSSKEVKYCLVLVTVIIGIKWLADLGWENHGLNMKGSVAFDLQF